MPNKMKQLLSILFFMLSVNLCAQQDDIYARQGLEFGKKGKYDSAIANFDKSLAINPMNFNALYYKGYTLEKEKKYNEAVNYYTRALSVNDEGFIYYRRGECYFYEKEDSLAILDFNIALSRIPGNDNILMSRASAYLRTKQYNKFLQDLDTHLSKNPGDYYSKANKGMALEELHRYDEALIIFKGLCDEMPEQDLHRIYYCVADAYVHMDSLEQANLYVEKSLSLKKNYEWAHFTKAEILLKQGDKNAACKEYRKAKRLGVGLDEEEEAEFSGVCD